MWLYNSDNITFINKTLKNGVFRRKIEKYNSKFFKGKIALNIAPNGVLIGDNMDKREKILRNGNYVHPIKWSYPMAIVLEEGCPRQHIYRGERRLKIYEN